MTTTTSNQELNGILERFKAEHIVEGGGIVDAWLEERGGESFLLYQLDIGLSELEPEALLEKMKAFPPEFEGVATVMTWFPREEEDV